MSKPVVIVGVQGGVADYQTIPPNSAEVIVIDYDNLDEYTSLEEANLALIQAREHRAKIETVLKRTKAPAMRKYLKGILADLADTIKGIEDDLPNWREE